MKTKKRLLSLFLAVTLMLGAFALLCPESEAGYRRGSYGSTVS